MSATKTISITTKRGITSQVRVWDRPGHGAPNVPIVYLHGSAGLLADEPMLDLLAEHHDVYAPVWPGYGEEPGEDALEDMQDFALHGWDVVDALDDEAVIGRPHVVGHSMGAMIAAEMACLSPSSLARLVLIDPLGAWSDETPIPDLFALLPYEFPKLLFHDVEKGTGLLTGGMDFRDPKALETFMVGNARRLGMAGKILFPIPNRRLRKRVYRLSAPTLLLWGAQDILVPAEPYARVWNELLPHAESDSIQEAGHMLPYEQPAAAASRIVQFLA